MYHCNVELDHFFDAFLEWMAECLPASMHIAMFNVSNFSSFINNIFREGSSYSNQAGIHLK